MNRIEVIATKSTYIVLALCLGSSAHATTREGQLETHVIRSEQPVFKANDELQPNDKVTLPVYDENGRRQGQRQITAKKAWDEINEWTDNTTRRYERDGAGERVRVRWLWDDHAQERLETVLVPQEPSQRRRLDRQQERDPIVDIEPRRLSTNINQTAGDNSTFGVFRNGNFSSEGDARNVKVGQSFSAGGFVFNKRISLVSQSTRSDSESKTTKTDIRVLDKSVFVSRDGTLNADKSFTRSKSIRKTFFVGLPVSVGGKISGSMGANMNYKAEPLAVTGSVSPFVNVSGSLDAGLDLFFVRAGVEGSLTFINNRIEATFDAGIRNRRLQAALKVQNNQTLVKGKVSIFASIRRIFRGFKKFSKTLFSFGGIQSNTTLIDERVDVRL